MEVGRQLSQRERQRLAVAMRQEDDAVDALADVLRRRDALIFDLRWGVGGQDPVLPDPLIRATVSKQHPDGLGRTTIHRIVGPVKDRPTSSNGSDSSGTSD